MKFKSTVSSSRRKQRKAHLGATSHQRRVRMSAPLSKELREKYNVRSVPLRKGDEVSVVSGKHAEREGKVLAVYRRKYAVHIAGVTRDNLRAQPRPVPFAASKVKIVKLNEKDNKDRKEILARKAAGRKGGKDKMNTVD